MAGLWAALRFLTRLPLPGRLGGSWDQFGQALPWFPAVGLVLGLIVAAADWALRQVFPPFAASALVVVLLVVLTGALHLDGLADTADAVFGHATPERRLEIMRDPRTGAFGATALACVLLLKIAAVVSLPGPARLGTLVLAPVVGRWSIVLLATLFPYARPQGLGTPLKASAEPRVLILATGLPVAIALGAHPAMLALTAIGAAVALAAGRWLMTKLPGLTGDCYGAVCEVVETAVLLAAPPVLALVR